MAIIMNNVGSGSAIDLTNATKLNSTTSASFNVTNGLDYKMIVVICLGDGGGGALTGLTVTIDDTTTNKFDEQYRWGGSGSDTLIFEPTQNEIAISSSASAESGYVARSFVDVYGIA